MKIGFSTQACPDWDWLTILNQAKALGYDGIELSTYQGRTNLTRVPEVADQPESTLRELSERGLELFCLATPVTFDSCSKSEVAGNQQLVRDHIELAGKLHCPMVRVFTGDIPGAWTREGTLGSIASAVAELAPFAGHHRVSIVVENVGDFAGSKDLWFISDAVRHPSIKCCWNMCHGMTVLERSTTTIPRLARFLKMIHVCDGDFDEQGRLVTYKLPGQGQLDVEGMIDLLRGVLFDGYLVFDWPKLTVDSLAAPDVALPAAREFLAAAVAKEHAALSAYKGDKNPAKFAERPS